MLCMMKCPICARVTECEEIRLKHRSDTRTQKQYERLAREISWFVPKPGFCAMQCTVCGNRFNLDSHVRCLDEYVLVDENLEARE